MKTLEFPDLHHLNSALGWLELGNHREAHAEAQQISVLGRAHQEAFLVRWRIASRAENWKEARRLAEVQTRAWPKRAVGWICLSYSLYRLRRPLEAWMQLLPKHTEFPTLSAIPYMLACYAFDLGNEVLVKRFLSRSAALGGPTEIPGAKLNAEDISALASPPPSPTTSLQSSLVSGNPVRPECRPPLR